MIFVDLDMQMPECCDDCIFQGKLHYCVFTNKNTHAGPHDSQTERAAFCPLKEKTEN